MRTWTAPTAALQAAAQTAAALLAQRRVPDAVAVYTRMQAAAPDQPWIALALGAALLHGTDTLLALRHFEALTQRLPRLEGAWHGLGKAQFDLRSCDAAVAAFTEAARLNTAPARALYHRGMAQLLAGNFAEGWRDYEHRLAVPELLARAFAQPRWQGEPLAGRRLLVVCEQGYGDVFQFIRFLPLLRHRGGSVVFECPGELRELLAPLLDGIEMVALRGRGAPDTAFDCHVALLSLPHVMGLADEAAFGAPPYLNAVPVTGLPSSFRRIGVCWAGSPTHPQDLHRSFAPEFLAPLARLPGVILVSLHKGRATPLALPGLDGFLTPPPLPLTDFMATARVIAGLDLVISVDTAVAHLAAAMGRPVWLLLPFAGEWRWRLARDTTAWYPTMRLFRQARLGDWSGVIDDLAHALAATE